MKTFFVRHTEKIDETARTRLWRDRMVAIHYPWDKHYVDGAPDSRSLDPDDYTGKSRGAIRALSELAQLGGYVCAEYYGRSECLVGTVDPGTAIGFIESQWSQE